MRFAFKKILKSCSLSFPSLLFLSYISHIDQLSFKPLLLHFCFPYFYTLQVCLGPADVNFWKGSADVNLMLSYDVKDNKAP